MRATALEVYETIKGSGYSIDSALELSEGMKKIEDFPKLSLEQRKQLDKLLSPAVKEVAIGPKKSSVSVGGDEVLYRHELRFMNKTAVFIGIDDSMSPAEVRKRIAFVSDFFAERIGQELRLDGIAIRFSSGAPDRFKRTIESVINGFKGPIIISAPRLKDIEPIIPLMKNMRPLINLEKEDAEKASDLAEKHILSLVLRSDDPKILADRSGKLERKGFDRIVFDASAGGIRKTILNHTSIRELAVIGKKDYGYPLISFLDEKTPYEESLYACILISRYSGILVLNTIEPFALLPVLTLRQGIYSDPRIQPRVAPGIYKVGEPTKDAPLLLTSNFALTYHSVLGDLEKGKVSCFILALDTEGLAVTVSLAADKMTAKAVKDALERYNANHLVSHKKLIIPGFASRLAEGISEETGWQVLVGPNDSSALPDYLKKY